jgi:Flp pilus assembly pilin Flp
MLGCCANSITNVLRRHEVGQTLVEYALLISFMAIGLVAALTALGVGTNGLYGVIISVVNSLSGS